MVVANLDDSNAQLVSLVAKTTGSWGDDDVRPEARGGGVEIAGN